MKEEDKELIQEYSAVLDVLTLSGAVTDEEMDVFNRIELLLKAIN